MKKNLIVTAIALFGASASFSSNFHEQVQNNKRHLSQTCGIRGFSDAVPSLETQEILTFKNETTQKLRVTINLEISDAFGGFSKSHSLPLSPNEAQTLYRRDLGSEFCTKGNAVDNVSINEISSIVIRLDEARLNDTKCPLVGETYTITENLLEQLK